MKLIFLGTNGWYDTGTGNTPSAFIETEKEYVVLDAGYGVYKINDYIDGSKPAYMFISHMHLDHICGLHTLIKLKFKQGLTIFYPKKMKKYMEMFVAHPFTAAPKDLFYKTKLVPLDEGGHAAPFEFTCRQLEHIDATYGYRMNLEGKIVAYCSDTAICKNDLLLAKNSDLLIHECSFTHKKQSAWGHTSPEEAGELAQEAKTKRLILTHFSGNGFINMAMRKKAEKTAKKYFQNSIAAEDGMEIEI